MSPLPPIYIISLKRTPERRLYMQRQLDALNLDYKIIDAIDKYDLLSKEYRVKIADQLSISEAWMEEGYEKITGNGWAVSLSHIKVFNMMKKDNIPMACILEDDQHLSPDFPKVLRDSQKISWDVLQLGNHSATLYDNLKSITSICPGSASFSKTLPRLKELGSHALQLPLYTVYRLLATVIEIIYETITGYFYFLVIGRPSNERYCGWRIRTAIYHIKAHYFIGIYCTSKVGGLPSRNKNLWHKLGFKYRIIPPQESAGSGGGYMITLKMANTFKQRLTTEYIHIDRLFYKLIKEGMKSYILSPPCIWQTVSYLYYSSKDK